MAATSGAETFTKVVAPSVGLILSNVMFLAPLTVRRGCGCHARVWGLACLRSLPRSAASRPRRAAPHAARACLRAWQRGVRRVAP
jgi:hypothetical protein